MFYNNFGKQTYYIKFGHLLSGVIFMIGYLFLGIALIAGATKGYCGKTISGKIKTLTDSVLVNTGRMLCCIVIGFLFTLAQDGFSSLMVEPQTLWIALLGGVCSALFVISWLFSVKQSAYMMVEVFLLIGSMIPISFSALFFDEKIRVIQGVGFVILCIAVYIMSTYNASIKGKISFKALLPLVVAGIANGLTDFSQKMFSRVRDTDSVSAFNLYTYVFAAAVLLLFYLFLRVRNVKSQESASNFKILRHIWVYILVMSLCLYINSYFKTLSSGYITATKLYPLNQGAAIILSLLMSSIFFKEKINAKCIFGISLAFIALLFINLL